MSSFLFRNVRIFDGHSDSLTDSQDVLVVDNKIASIGTDLAQEDAQVIEGADRTLMPGLIDNHVHLVLCGGGLGEMETGMTWEDLAIGGTANARLYLHEGFTTVRDMGGTNGGLQRAIDAGTIEGPRVYPSGAFIGGRGGHADFAPYSSQPNGPTQMEMLNISRPCNGADQVLLAARNNFRMGASQIKIMQTGGVASEFDPWQLNGMTAEEIAAAVEVADAYQSYVAAHSYSADAMVRALDMGVRSIEHGFMFNDEVHAKMVEKGAVLTTNLTAFTPELSKVEALQNPRSARKFQSATEAFKDYIDNVRRLKPKRGFQTDCVGPASINGAQIAHEKYLAGDFFGNHEALVSMTSVGGEIAEMSGPVLNPYPEGKLGVVEEGAYADLLLVDGNPLEDLSVIGAVKEWFSAPPRDGVETMRIIMKDGVVVKNTL
jgi:imidazolonepropionase-like amidohydrolase